MRAQYRERGREGRLLFLTSLQDPSLPGSACCERTARHKALGARGDVGGFGGDQEKPRISFLVPGKDQITDIYRYSPSSPGLTCWTEGLQMWGGKVWGAEREQGRETSCFDDLLGLRLIIASSCTRGQLEQSLSLQFAVSPHLLDNVSKPHWLLGWEMTGLAEVNYFIVTISISSLLVLLTF